MILVGERFSTTSPARRARDLALSGDPVEVALAQIRLVARTASLQLALDVGEIVFFAFFDGDPAKLRERGPKDMSFRRLALHPELPMSATNLWRAVAIYELSSRFSLVRRSKHIGITHVRVVLGLPEPDQEELLLRAENERWHVSHLQAQAQLRRKGSGGRPRKPAILKTLDALRRVAGLPVSVFADRRAVRRLGDEDVDVALETLRELEERTTELRKVLRERKRGYK